LVTNKYPSISNLVKIAVMNNAWNGCSNNISSVQDLLGDCLWITGRLKNVSFAFADNIKLSGFGMPLVTAITNSPGFPTGYTYISCFQNCTNLTDWNLIPITFK
jgi:hypothetical protein